MFSDGAFSVLLMADGWMGEERCQLSHSAMRHSVLMETVKLACGDGCIVYVQKCAFFAVSDVDRRSLLQLLVGMKDRRRKGSSVHVSLFSIV